MERNPGSTPGVGDSLVHLVTGLNLCEIRAYVQYTHTIVPTRHIWSRYHALDTRWGCNAGSTPAVGGFTLYLCSHYTSVHIITLRVTPARVSHHVSDIGSAHWRGCLIRNVYTLTRTVATAPDPSLVSDTPAVKVSRHRVTVHACIIYIRSHRETTARGS